MEHFLEQHSGELTILVMTVLVLGTLLVVVPQLLRAYHQAMAMEHAEHMQALEQGQNLPPPEHLSRLGGRVAFLVPIVVVCVAGTVTCFLAAYKTDNTFSVTLVVWIIAGAVSLAAVTGGVALMGRLAPRAVPEDEEATENPLE
jgi:hypothetical protein